MLLTAKFKVTPNRLTLLRILLLPLPCALLFLESCSAKIAALSLGSLLGITDYLDGVLARKTRKLSPVGALLDPVADKIFITAVYFTLVYLNYFSFLPVAIILSREVLVSHLRSWFPEETRVIPITKLKTAFQMSIAGIAVIIKTYFPEYVKVIDYFLWFLAFFSFFSALPYFYRVSKHLKKMKSSLSRFFYSSLSLFYPLTLIITFPFAGRLFWINVLALSFYFFKKGLARSSPKLAQKESLLMLFVLSGVLLEYLMVKHLEFSLWGVFAFSLFRDGIRTLETMWNILKL
jgi:CDP-diacylglycerol--glycerol-3-phosphate 3-phosphatidyltransferase